MKKRVGLTLMELLPILGIVVALFSLAIGKARWLWVVGGMQMASWTDEFEGQKLHRRWRWVAPVGGRCELRNGWLVLSVPQREKGFNHWRGIFEAPMVLTDLPDRDWVAETSLQLSDYPEDADFHVGIAIAVSERYLWLWGLFYSATTWKMRRPELWLERTGEAKLLSVPDIPLTVDLRVERRGWWLHFFWRIKGKARWKEAGRSLLWFAPKHIGLIVKTWGKGRPLMVRFDSFRLETRSRAPKPLTAMVRIDTRRRLNEINPMIYGQFIEHLGRCIYGGIWAEMLYNRKMHCEVQENGVVEGWHPLGRNARWHADNEDFFVGGQSQVIVGTGQGEHGITQGGLDLLPKAYIGRVIVKGEGVREVTVSLRKGRKVLARRTLRGITGRWKDFRFRLTVPPQKEMPIRAAQFALSFRGKGKLWVGALSLMPADNVDGMRKDVLDAIRDIHPPIVRWPGGNFVSGYDWRDGIGDPDKRPPRWDRAWNAWEWNDFGTEEFIKFCQYIGAEPYICVNAGEGYEHEAMEWMAYCQGKGYPIRYWGVGNEMYGRWQLGHLDATKYALKAVLFARAMRKVHPDAKLILVGVPELSFNRWNEKVLRVAGPHFDLLSVHYYQSYDVKDDPKLNYTVVVSAPIRVEKMLRETYRVIEQSRPKGKRIKIAFDEWNVWGPHQTIEGGLEGFYALQDGLFAAGVFHALWRCGDFVEVANLAQTVNVLGALRTSQTQVIKTPIYWVFWLYVRNTGKWRVECKAQTPVGSTPIGQPTPVVDTVASLSEDGGDLYVALINRHPEATVIVSLALMGFRPRPTARMGRLSSHNFWDTNTFDEPGKVRPIVRTLRLDEPLKISLPPHSVTLLCFRRG